MKVDLSVDLAGLRLPNPLLPGSGPPGDSLRKLKKLMDDGIGGLVTKTISVQTPEIPRPAMAFEGEHLFFNVEKWSSRPHAEWRDTILPELENRQVPLIASLGYTAEDLEMLIPVIEPLVDGFELSTHYIASSSTLLLDTIRRARALTQKPIFVKLSWHGGDMVSNAIIAEKAGASGITAINSIGPVMAIDIKKKASRLGRADPNMWLSGPAIKPMALRAVFEIARAVDIPVIGCGGVTTGEDVVEFMLAGATAVQSCTGLIRKGNKMIREVIRSMTRWCPEQDVSTIRDIVGTVTPHFVKLGG